MVLEPRAAARRRAHRQPRPQTGEAIHELFLELNRERGTTLLVVTHNPELAALMPRRLRMVDGGHRRRSTAPRDDERRCLARPTRRPRSAASLACRRSCAARRAGLRRDEPRREPAAADRRRAAGDAAPRPQRCSVVARSSSAATARSRTTRSASSCSTKPGTLLDAGEAARGLRAMWKMGFFADIDVEAEVARVGRRHADVRGQGEAVDPQGAASPATSELGLDKINEVLDLELDAILDVAKVKKNREKIARPLRPEGLLPRDGRLRGQAGQRGRGRRLVQASTRRPRSRSARSSSSATTRSPTTSCAASIATRREDALSFLNDSRHLQRGAFERDLLLVQRALLGPRLRQRQGRHAAAPAVARQAVHVPLDPDRRGPGLHDRHGRLQGRPDRQRRGEPRAASRCEPGETFSRTQDRRGPREALRLLQGPGLRLRERPAADQGRPRRSSTIDAHLRGRSAASAAYFERINIRGNTKTRDKVIRREMKIVRGRAVQQHEPRDLASAASPRSASSRTSTSRPSAAAPTSSSRSTSRSPSGRPARSRSAPASRRSRTSSPRRRSRRTTCSAAARRSRCRRRSRACASCSCCASSSRTSSTRSWTFAFDLYNQSRGFGTFFAQRVAAAR